MTLSTPAKVVRGHTQHPRTFRAFQFVYPVLSRRSRGISIGINLNPDKVCNLDCIYCQVDRRTESAVRTVDVEVLLAELEEMLDQVLDGRLFEDEQFRDVPAELRRLNDIAFSGDGEPTTERRFEEIVERVAQIKRRRGLDQVKIVLITNATMFDRPAVNRALEVLDQNQGEIWAKLDAGTEAYYRLVDRTSIPFQRVLRNITDAARRRPLVIQSLFMRVRGEPPSEREIDEFCLRLKEIVAVGGRIKLVQVYTVARPPTEPYVTALSDAEVDAIAEKVRRAVGLPVEAYYGRSSDGES